MNIKLHYEEKGDGFPLILLHGNGGSLEYFVNQTDHFSKFYRVIAIDSRGHGRSERGKAEFSIKQFADDLYIFMRSHGIEKAHILGFSDGGNVALYFALSHPEMVERLVLNGANIDPSGVKRRYQAPIEKDYATALASAETDGEAKKNAEMLGLMVNWPKIRTQELSALTMPTLVIAGTDDMIKKTHTRIIAENIPDAKLVFLEGDHFIACKVPEEFNRVVGDFLSGGDFSDE